VQNNTSTAVMWSKSKSDVEFQYGGRLGEFHGMSSQSHISHCRALPLGEFTVMIPEPHAVLQGAVTWQNQCHDRATLQGVIIPSAILTRGQSNLTKSASRGAHSPVRGHLRGSKVVPSNSWGRVSY